jgi:hypothetical protein
LLSLCDPALSLNVEDLQEGVKKSKVCSVAVSQEQL